MKKEKGATMIFKRRKENTDAKPKKKHMQGTSTRNRPPTHPLVLHAGLWELLQGELPAQRVGVGVRLLCLGLQRRVLGVRRGRRRGRGRRILGRWARPVELQDGLWQTGANVVISNKEKKRRYFLHLIIFFFFEMNLIMLLQTELLCRNNMMTRK